MHNLLCRIIQTYFKVIYQKYFEILLNKSNLKI
jgi:hypothetical protein